MPNDTSSPAPEYGTVPGPQHNEHGFDDAAALSCALVVLLSIAASLVAGTEIPWALVVLLALAASTATRAINGLLRVREPARAS